MNHRESLTQYTDAALARAQSLENPHGYKLLVIATLDEPGDENDGVYTIRSSARFTINTAVALLTRAVIALATGKQWSDS